MFIHAQKFYPKAFDFCKIMKMCGKKYYEFRKLDIPIIKGFPIHKDTL